MNDTFGSRNGFAPTGDPHRCSTPAVLRRAILRPVFCALTAAWCLTFSGDASGAGVLEAARGIVETYTADQSVDVRSFDSGLRVIGVSLAGEDDAVPGIPHSPYEFSWDPPDWLKRDRLLGYVDSGSRITMRLLWRVEPFPETRGAVEHFAVALNEHRGLRRVSQEGGPAEVRPTEHARGTVFWTEHRFPASSTSTPGLFDVTVTRLTQVSVAIPLGQLFVQGRSTHTAGDSARMRGLYPAGFPLLEGRILIGPWSTYTMDLAGLEFAPKQLVLVSSIPWLEKEEQALVVGEVTLVRASGEEESYPVRLGMETAYAGYEWSKRGGINHSRAEVAWTWPRVDGSFRYEAAAYQARFALGGKDSSPPVAVRLSNVLGEGVLTVHGLSLLP